MKGETGMLAELFCDTLSNTRHTCTALESNPNLSSREPQSRCLICVYIYIYLLLFIYLDLLLLLCCNMLNIS